MKKALLLYNPKAGRAALDCNSLDAIRLQLRREAIDAEIVVTEPDGLVLANRDVSGIDMLIVAGGDGTIHEAIQVAAPNQITLGVIPCGTANVLARELRIPAGLQQAISVIGSGQTRSISLGHSPQFGYFHLMAGIGLDAHVVTRVGSRLKRRMGRAAFWLQGFIHVWTYDFHEFLVTADSNDLPARFAVVSNARTYGGQLLLTPRAHLEEAMLDLCLFESSNPARYWVHLWGALRGKHLQQKGVTYRKARHVQIRSDQPVGVQMDGEFKGVLPVDIEIVPKALRVLLPEETRGENVFLRCN